MDDDGEYGIYSPEAIAQFERDGIFVRESRVEQEKSEPK